MKIHQVYTHMYALSLSPIAFCIVLCSIQFQLKHCQHKLPQSKPAMSVYTRLTVSHHRDSFIDAGISNR